ncbi:MAG: 6-bladed beta-propeller [Candidatus Methylomirabilaceae bacterium]
MQRSSALLTLAVSLAVNSSCSSDASSKGSDSSPVLLVTDSIHIRDPSADPFGRLGDFLPLESSGYLLVDAQNTRLLEYDARGSLVRQIGRKGSGPGELQHTGPIAVDGDSVLYILDSPTLHVFDFRTGAFRRKGTLRAPFGTSIVVTGPHLYFRAFDSTQVPRFAAWRNGTVVLGPSLPSLSELETVKAAGAGATALMMNTTHAGAVFAPISGDTIAVLSQASEDIVLTNLRGILGRIPVARAQRNGVLPDLIAQVAKDPTIAQRDPLLLYAPSVPGAITRGAGVHYLTVKTDFAFVRDHFSGKLYLSVTGPVTGLTCPDARVPGPEDPPPSIALRGDTLFVLSQTIQESHAVTVLRKYLVQTANCKWTRTGAA